LGSSFCVWDCNSRSIADGFVDWEHAKLPPLVKSKVLVTLSIAMQAFMHLFLFTSCYRQQTACAFMNIVISRRLCAWDGHLKVLSCDCVFVEKTSGG
jgi:hypothetical protein